MDRAFIECQYIETYRLINKQFEHSYCVDPLGDSLQVGIDNSSLKLQRKLDDDYKQLVEDQKVL